MITRIVKIKELQENLQLLVETLIKQCSLIEDLLENGWIDSNHKLFLENEDRINSLVVTIRQKLSEIIILFSPRGKELRKILFSHEVIIYMELMGNLFCEIVSAIENSDPKLKDYSDYKDYIAAFIKSFDQAKDIVQKAYYSFYSEDVELAKRIIRDNQLDQIAERKNNTLNIILSDFEEIPLKKEELVNIMAFDKIFLSLEKTTRLAVYIAKSTIFAIESSDIE